MGMVLTAYSNDEIVKYVDRSNPEVDELCIRLEDMENLKGQLEFLHSEKDLIDEEIIRLRKTLKSKNEKIAELRRSLIAINSKAGEIKRKTLSLFKLFPQASTDSTKPEACCGKCQGGSNV